MAFLVGRPRTAQTGSAGGVLTLTSPAPAVIELAWARAGEVEADPGLLDPEEMRRAQGQAQEADRACFLAAHTLLRRRLAERVGGEPGALEIIRDACPRCGGPHGRPCLADRSGLHFSLARSRDLILVGLAEAPIGVDVRGVASPDTVRRVTPQLHPREQRAILAAPPGRSRALFTSVWARKEAYLKGLGVGLEEDLAACCLTDEADAAPDGWVVVDVAAPAGYAAAAAVRAA